jgi:hypothetical protein
MAETGEPPKQEPLEKIVHIIQNVGLIAGGLGSLAVLFFWIGNVIVISRLREYNLYGIVHYTDEYVKEAGYQFLQDVFTFFHDPVLIALSVAVVSMIVLFVPVGPYKKKGDLSFSFGLLKNPVRIIEWLKRTNGHYIIFFVIAFVSTLALALDLGARNLARDIMADTDTLQRIIRQMDDAAQNKEPAFFSFRQHQAVDTFQNRFIADLALDTKPTRTWVVQSIRNIGYGDKGASDDQLIAAFQKDMGVENSPDIFMTKESIEKSETYRKLKQISMNERLNGKIYSTVKNVSNIFVSLLEGDLNTPDDYATLVQNPGNYAYLNGLVDHLMYLRKNVIACFDLRNDTAKNIMGDISTLTRIRLGNKLITISFLTMVGLLVYLLLNITELSKFDVAEKGYYFMMIVLFVAISITLPTVYGRYNFEFRIQRVNAIAFTDETEMEALKTRLQKNLDKDQAVYVLGPTRDKEIIVSTILQERTSESTPQIIVMDRAAIRYIILEPVKSFEIPALVNMLKRSSRL